MRTVNNQIFTGFRNCKYKAYLKLQGKTGKRSEYEELEASLSEEYQICVQRHVADSGILVTKETLEVTDNVTLRDGSIVVHIDALVREQHSSEVSQVRYIPVIFSYRNKITKNGKLLIAFVKSLAEEYTKILSPIIETIGRYGLKKYHLKKHKSQVDRFFKRILGKDYNSENAQKFQQRFRKYREKLFTFLDYDGVPWNNNNAEHMIKRIVRIRRKIRRVTTAKGVGEYCVLLSIYETLRLRNLSFLDFRMP